MSEHLPHPQDDDAGDETAEPTGHPLVDEVLRATQGLGDRPVEEHVAVFEAAHDKLRAALSDAGGRPDAPRSGG